MSTATAARICSPAHEQRLLAEAHAIVTGRSMLLATDLHLLACVNTAAVAEERARLATEALEAKDREVARLQDQLRNERTHYAAVEVENEHLDRLASDALGAVVQFRNQCTRVKSMIAQKPISAGSGAGV